MIHHAKVGLQDRQKSRWQNQAALAATIFLEPHQAAGKVDIVDVERQHAGGSQTEGGSSRKATRLHSPRGAVFLINEINDAPVVVLYPYQELWYAFYDKLKIAYVGDLR